MIIAATVLAILIVVYVIVIDAVAPSILKSKIISALKDSCSDCELQIESVETNAIQPWEITLKKINLKAGQPGRSSADVKIEILKVDVKILAALSKQLIIESLEGDVVDVTYAEGEALKKAAAPNDEGGDPLLFAIENTRVSNLEFRYAHSQHGVTSFLRVHKISAWISGLGNTPELKDQLTNGEFRGVIEKSGQAQLKIAALTRPGLHYVDVNLFIDKQKLDDLNSFFTGNDGIVFHGLLLHANATVNVRDQKSKAHVEGTYKEVDFKQTATATTSAVEAVLTNLGADLLMNKTNTDRLPRDREADLEVQRKKGEALVHFILRSMKECALEVAKKKDSRK